MIGMDGERKSEEFALSARLDDVDNDNSYRFLWKLVLFKIIPLPNGNYEYCSMALVIFFLIWHLIEASFENEIVLSRFYKIMEVSEEDTM